MISILRDKTAYFAAAVLGFFLLFILSDAVPAADFIDSDSNWNRMEISQLQGMGILSGYPGGLFQPEEAVTRAEFAKMLVLALGEQEAAAELSGVTSIFSDIPYEFWAKGYVMAGVEQGWLLGRGIYFDPDAAITRQEGALILSRFPLAEQLPEDDPEAELAARSESEIDPGQRSEDDPGLKFTDNDEIAAWAAAGVQKAAAWGWLSGFPDGSFRPQEPLSRAEAVRLLTQLMEQKGFLFDFHGLLKKVDSDGLTIQVAGGDKIFKLAAGAQIFDRNNLITVWKDIIPARLNFNLNRRGEIIYGQLSYTNEYLDLTVKQLQAAPTQPEDIAKADVSSVPTVGETLAAAAAETDKDSTVAARQEQASLTAAQEVSGIKQLQEAMKLSGRGVTMAIIDSGIDPLQQDLQRLPDGQRKIIDWVNFSDEGRVETNLSAYSAEGKYLDTERGQYLLPAIERSQSGQYRYGFWAEEWITYLHDYDFTNNNSAQDQILVLLVDAKTAGVYDTVFVDTNHNFNLADEVPLKIYRDNKHSYAAFPKTADLPQGFPFVLCDIWEDGQAVSFGYDSEGHGTHVAGIAAANGGLQGAAPGAQLIALKVADSAGVADLSDMLRAVEYAVSKGVNIINISLGYYERDEEAIANFRHRLNELAAHTLICVAAGNDGPGLSTLAFPADVPRTLAVGAYVAPEMLDADYGWTAQAANPWYFSSTGPAADGSLKPDLLAPGSAVSTLPVWQGQAAQLIEGSSMAAPFVAGSAALLMEEMWRQGQGFNSLMLKQALVGSARQLEHLSPAEQGFGVLDAYAALKIALQQEGLPDDSGVKVSSHLGGAGAGLLSRQSLPGRTVFSLDNYQRETEIEWQSQVDWLHLENNPLFLPADSQRNLRVSYDLPVRPGLYTGLIVGTFADASRAPLKIFNSVVVPQPWSKSGEIDLYDDLSSGQMRRLYLQIPPEEKTLRLKLKVLGSANKLQGRVRMHIYDADGQLYSITEFAGVAPQGLTAQREIVEEIKFPRPGVWEVVVYSSSTLSNYDLSESNYVFNAKLERWLDSPVYTENEFVIGAACLRGNKSRADIRLTILNAGDNTPYSGPLQINERLYYVERGKVLITTEVNNQSMNLEIKRVNPGL